MVNKIIKILKDTGLYSRYQDYLGAESVEERIEKVVAFETDTQENIDHMVNCIRFNVEKNERKLKAEKLNAILITPLHVAGVADGAVTGWFNYEEGEAYSFEVSDNRCSNEDVAKALRRLADIIES